MTTVIFGGSGKVARHLIKILAGRGQAVYGVIRREEQAAELEALGAHAAVESIEKATLEEMTSMLRGINPETVVWSAGAGAGSAERTRRVDYEGAVMSMDACAAAGVRRFIMVSARDVRDRSKAVPAWYGPGDVQQSDATWGAIGTYMQAKFDADKNLRELNGTRRLDYTIVRPCGLSLEPGTGKIAAGRVAGAPKIPREDVARVIAACIDEPGTIGLAIDVVGGDTAIEKAIARVAAAREDSFEG